MNKIRNNFGLRWHSRTLPREFWRNAFYTLLLIALIVAGYTLVAINEAHAASAVLVGFEATHERQQKDYAEVALIRLLRGETLIVDQDFVSCRLRDRASSRGI